MLKFFVLALIFFLISSYAIAQQKAQNLLFESHDILELTIVSDYNDITEDVYGSSDDHKGKLIYHDSNDNKVKVEIEIETRGNFRRNPDNCDFPPLEIDFDGDYQNTIFQGQNKLKLVTHCRDTLENADENVMKEYLIYRIYNMLTPQSFKVRLCKINYRQRWWINTKKRIAFFIEDNDDVAERLGGKELDKDDDYLPIDSLCLARMALFQYMIGNSDWTIMPLQNTEVIKVPGKNSFPVPYDFDLSAFVNAVYAPKALFIEPEELYNRVYKGPELSSRFVKEAKNEFLQKREDLEQLVEQENRLSEGEKERILNYIESFYSDIKSGDINTR